MEENSGLPIEGNNEFGIEKNNQIDTKDIHKFQSKENKRNIEMKCGDWKAPLGVTKIGDWLNFSISLFGVAECCLLLVCYEKKEVYIKFELSKEFRNGTIFSIMIKEKQLEADGYYYEVNGAVVQDPYARLLFGRDQYGKMLKGTNKHLICGTWKLTPFDWAEDKRPKLSFTDLVLYKLHVRGFTKHISSQCAHRGTYQGILEKLDYIKGLGVNALILMPCTEFDEVIIETPNAYTNGNTSEEDFRLNYWGYTKTSHYFAPKSSYSSVPRQADWELKKMVKVLHENDIEVILEMGFSTSTNQNLILDCLRYWTSEYHIDGFLLASDVISPYLVAADPFLSMVKIISSGWNGENSYYLDENKNLRLAEYNNDFLNNIRRFAKGDEGQTGSLCSHILQKGNYAASINTITDHNGFTLADLYSYDRKHNEANGEENRDGSDFNSSWNCGAEGLTKRKKINDLRLQMMKNILTLLFLAQGTPMLLAGDEFGNSQGGNNNAYCQDNTISWLDWKSFKKNESLFLFTKQLIALRKQHPVLHNKNILKNMDYLSCGCPDISFHGIKAWYPDYSNYSRVIGILLCGEYAKGVSGGSDNYFYIIYNMHWEKHTFDLPSLPKGYEWERLFTTGIEDAVKPASVKRKGKEKKSIEQENKTLDQEREDRYQYLAVPRSSSVFISRQVSSVSEQKKREGKEKKIELIHS